MPVPIAYGSTMACQLPLRLMLVRPGMFVISADGAAAAAIEPVNAQIAISRHFLDLLIHLFIRTPHDVFPPLTAKSWWSLNLPSNEPAPPYLRAAVRSSLPVPSSSRPALAVRLDSQAQRAAGQRPRSGSQSGEPRDG